MHRAVTTVQKFCCSPDRVRNSFRSWKDVGGDAIPLGAITPAPSVDFGPVVSLRDGRHELPQMVLQVSVTQKRRQ